MIFSSLCCGYISDRARKKLLLQTGAADVGLEHRVKLQIVGIAILPVGGIVYAWVGHFAIHAAATIVGISICRSSVLSAESADIYHRCIRISMDSVD